MKENINNPLYEIIYETNTVKVLDKFLWIKEYKLNTYIYQKFLEKYSKMLHKTININNISIEVSFIYSYTIWYGYPKTNISQLLEVAKMWNIKYCEYLYYNFFGFK